VARLLKEHEYSLQGNRKMLQIGEAHIDRNAQFEYINHTVKVALKDNIPAISIDTKKKENIGNFENEGQEYREKGDARKLLDHDFPMPELGKVAPYGVYTINNNKGFVNLGTSRDTPNFAVDSIYAWWETVGSINYPSANRLLIYPLAQTFATFARGFLARGKEAPTTHTQSSMLGGADAVSRQKDRASVAKVCASGYNSGLWRQ